jgi:hypothetical protein
MNCKYWFFLTDFGGISMKPNFESMSNTDLKAYILAHRDDLEALDALVSRRTPDENAVWFHPPTSHEEEQQQFESFKQGVEQRSRR